VLKTSLIAAAIALLFATSAHASDFTLRLSAPPAVVGEPLILNATGTIDVDELQYPYWFSLDAIPTSVTTTCPADRWEAVQIAQGTGGTVVVLSQRETPDATGHFTIPVGITPTAPGSVLLCGYTDDGATNTLARASLRLDITSAADRPNPPVELKRAIRGCHALLSGKSAKRCVRKAVRRARAGCRSYPSLRGQARCLRKVRRVARSA
jgi:hypothetical protein